MKKIIFLMIIISFGSMTCSFGMQKRFKKKDKLPVGELPVGCIHEFLSFMGEKDIVHRLSLVNKEYRNFALNHFRIQNLRRYPPVIMAEEIGENNIEILKKFDQIDLRVDGKKQLPLINEFPNIAHLKLKIGHCTEWPMLPQGLKSLDLKVCRGFDFSSMGPCKNLESLVFWLMSLKRLTDLPASLRSLVVLQCISFNPSVLEGCPNLECLVLCGSNNLERLKELPETIKILGIHGCDNFDFSILDSLPNLEDLAFSDIDLSQLKQLPKTLKSLCVEKCTNFNANSVSGHPSLENLELIGGDSVFVDFNGVAGLPKGLKSLTLERCFPVDLSLLSQCTSLEKLVLKRVSFSSLVALPQNLKFVAVQEPCYLFSGRNDFAGPGGVVSIDNIRSFCPEGCRVVEWDPYDSV